MSDEEGLAWGGGGDERWGRGGGVKVQKYISATQYRSREIFFIAKNFFVDDDTPLLVRPLAA